LLDVALRCVGEPRRALEECLRRNEVPVVAGFQGLGLNQRIVTLGRGGSDTTAVALAIALGADYCEFYKDVDGVHSSDPKRDPLAFKLDFVTYEEMSALIQEGAQVLHDKAVQLAAQSKMPLHLRSSFHAGEGSWVGARDALVIVETREQPRKEQKYAAEERFA
jgi:aspartate kinase